MQFHIIAKAIIAVREATLVGYVLLEHTFVGTLCEVLIGGCCVGCLVKEDIFWD